MTVTYFKVPQTAEELEITPYKVYSITSQPHASHSIVKLQASSSEKSIPSLSFVICVVLHSNTNHLQVLPREPGGFQFSQHQRRAEVVTDLGQELAQYMLDKLP